MAAVANLPGGFQTAALVTEKAAPAPKATPPPRGGKAPPKKTPVKPVKVETPVKTKVDTPVVKGRRAVRGKCY